MPIVESVSRRLWDAYVVTHPARGVDDILAPVHAAARTALIKSLAAPPPRRRNFVLILGGRDA